MPKSQKKRRAQNAQDDEKQKPTKRLREPTLLGGELYEIGGSLLGSVPPEGRTIVIAEAEMEVHVMADQTLRLVTSSVTDNRAQCHQRALASMTNELKMRRADSVVVKE